MVSWNVKEMMADREPISARPRSKTELLASHRVFETTSHEDGQRFASEIWEQHRSVLKHRDFALTWNQAGLVRTSLAFIDHPCALVATCEGPLSDTFRLAFQLGGRMDHRINGKETVALPGTCAVHPPSADLRLDIEPFSVLLLGLDGGFVRSALNQRFSNLPPLETWATALPTGSPATATINSFCFWMAKELEDPRSMLLTQPRVAASFERTLLSLFVECLVELHPSAGYIRGNLSELHVRRAEEWIDANLGEPIGAEEVAAAIGVDAHALVETFKCVRGRSPTKTIFHRRLERAREILAWAGPGTTVTEVAMRLGFWETGRFAVRYRERFGERPSDTLARSPGHQAEPATTMQEKSRARAKPA